MNDPPAQKPKLLDWKKKKERGDMAAMTVMMSLCQKEKEAKSVWAAVKSSVLQHVSL